MIYTTIEVITAIMNTCKDYILIWCEREGYEQRYARIFHLDDTYPLLEYLMNHYRPDGMSRHGKECITGYYLFDDYTDLKGVYKEVRE